MLVNSSYFPTEIEEILEIPLNENEKKELLEEMAVAVKDYFICAVEQEEQGLVLAFSSGQKFLFSVEEMN